MICGGNKHGFLAGAQQSGDICRSGNWGASQELVFSTAPSSAHFSIESGFVVRGTMERQGGLGKCHFTYRAESIKLPTETRRLCDAAIPCEFYDFLNTKNILAMLRECTGLKIV